MLATLELLPSKYENPFKWRGSCKRATLSAKYVVIPCNMDSFNTKVKYVREPKQPPQEIHHCGACGCSLIQHGNSNCVIAIYKTSFDAPGVTPTGSRKENTNSFFIVNVEVRKAID